MEEKLIEAVRVRPPIYNLKHPGYKNLKLREKLWREISGIVGEPIERCRQRWKSLRERARKEFTQYVSSGSGLSEPISWPYLEPLSFLKDSFGITKTISNFVDEVGENYEEETSYFEEELPGIEVEVMAEDAATPTRSTPMRPSSSLSAKTTSFQSECGESSRTIPLPSSGTFAPTPSDASTSSSWSTIYNKRRKKNGDQGEIIAKAVDSFNNLLGDIRSKYVNQNEETSMMLFFRNLSKKLENRYDEVEELELQQAILDVVIKKTKELDSRRQN